MPQKRRSPHRDPEILNDFPERILVAERRRSFRRIAGGLAGLALVMVLGTLGYVLMGWSLSDSIFMVAVTISTVGYGEVRPLDTTMARAHTMAIIGLGVVAVGYLVANILQLMTEGEIRRLLGHQRVKRHIETLSGHTIVVGFGRMGAFVCDELKEAGVPFLVIERADDRVAEIERRGWLHVHGDATEEKVLLDAGIDRASGLVTAMPSDAENVFVTLSARQMGEKLRIVARAEHHSTLKKLKQAGADQVVMPAAIGAHRIVSLLINPLAVEFAELVTHQSSLTLEMDELKIAAGSPLDGRNIRGADIARRTGVVVIAVKHVEGRVEFPPSGDSPLAAGDAVVVLGRREGLDQFRREYQPKTDGQA